jgi:hypothetical protein
MESDSMRQRDQAELLARLKGASSSSYLTLMSIVQGAVLADLAGVVANNYAHFDLEQWFLVLPTFLLIIAAWNQVTMDTITWVQLPNMVGAIIPFLVGACEFFLNHSLGHDPRVWLIGAAIILTFSTLGIRMTEQNIALHEENATLLAHVRGYRQAGQRYNAGSAAVLLVLAGLSVAGLFSRIDDALHQPEIAAITGGTVASLILLGFLARHLFYWRVVLAYARQQPVPVKKHHA